MTPARRRYDQLMAPTYAPAPPVFVRGAGSRLWDEGGKEYIDFGGGIAVVSLGHCHPPLAAAIAEQARTLMHISNLHVNAPAIRLAELLTESTFADRVFLCNSGAEANEAAIKLARRRGVSIAPAKHQVLAFEGGFHGRIGMAMAATHGAKVRDGFGPLAPGFRFAPYGDLAAAAARMDDDVCAVIVEPAQGEGGVNIPPPGFLPGLRGLADKHRALLIYDEIQTGAGRSGALYDYMNGDVVPDVLTSAKGLGGGFPVAAMLATAAAAGAFSPGAHGTTYGGNPLAARAAVCVLETVLEEGFLPAVRARAETFAERIRQLPAAFFADIRQCGLLLGASAAGGKTAAEISRAALDEGLVVITAGGDTLRFAPALNIPPEDIDEGFSRLCRALQKLGG